MKKLIASILSLALIGALSIACADSKLVIGASPSPHAEILEFAKAQLAEKGIELEIVEFTDYVQPNLQLDTGDLDANYFQHQPYLTDFCVNNGTKLISAGNVHYEPMVIMPGTTSDLTAIREGAVIAVPNDTTNEARALLLLEANGIITLPQDAGLTVTAMDIAENPYKVEILEVEAAQVARMLDEVDFAVINGNYALDAKLDVVGGSLAREEADSEAASTYANIVAVREGDETREDIVALIQVLQSEETQAFITENYQGAVLPKL